MIASDPPLSIAMLSIHSSPVGALGARDTGGMSVHIRELAAALARRGHAVDVFTCRGEPGGPTVSAPAPGVRLIRLPPAGDDPVPKEALFGRVPEIAETLLGFPARNRTSYDLVHSHYWISGEVGRRVAFEKAVPHVITFHTLAAVKNLLQCGEREPGQRVDCERELARGCDAVVVGAERERGNVVRHCGVPGRKVRLLPCGVDLTAFPLGDHHAARREVGWKNGEQVLLYVGRFTPVKGLDRLLRAVSRLISRHPNLVLAVVGGEGRESEDERALRSLAADLGVGERVRWLGSLPHSRMAVQYRAADGVVVPSHYESFGLVVLEALAGGTPVVATRVGVADQVIRDGTNGILVPCPDPERLAEGIDRLLETTFPTRAELRRTVLRYDWDVGARVGEDIYNEVLKSAGRFREPAPASA